MAIPNFPELERKILQDWKDQDVFGQTLKKPAPRGNFVFFEGPPFANGIPHIGHVEARAFKDLILRYRTMAGYHVDRKAGWDTQGLPVELEVERTIGVSGKKDIEKYGVAKFNAAARESVWKYKKEWETMTERMAYWLDLDHPYVTYTNDYIETLWWIFRQAWDQKLLEQDFKVVPYCPRCGTALSSHEVAQGYETVTEKSVYLKFELVDEPGTFVLAWTTTPWTLPGNVALAVKEDIGYIKTSPNSKGERFIVARERAPFIFGKDHFDYLQGDNPGEIILGSQLVGKKYKPLFDFIDLREEAKKKRTTAPTTPGATPPYQGGEDYANTYTIVPADFVTTEDGTGVVHTAVMYGVEDFELGEKVGLPKIHTVDENGRFNELVKPWVGWKVKDSDPEVEAKTREAIIDYLREAGKLYDVRETTHEYPFCWRCKSPLLYYAKTSWFIRMSRLRDQLLANNEKINWYPNYIKDGRFGEWLREVKDWAISRERYWGTPLPIWVCDECKHQECHGSYADLASHVKSKNRYFILRHGESDNNVDHTLDTEMADGSSHLTATGQAQATAAAKKLKAHKIDLIYTSQFPRAVETAEIIAKELGLDPDEDVELNEFHIGPVYENKPFAEYHEKFARKEYRFDHAPAGGENLVQVQQRMVKFFKQMEAEHDGKNIVVVSHADPILVAQWAFSFQPRPAIDEMHFPENGEVFELNAPVALFNDDGLFDPHRPYIDGATYPCPKCGSHHPRRDPSLSRRGGVMTRTPEVGDTWFDSGSMPYAQWHYPFEHKDKIEKGDAFPADYISEAIDQTRGWFYTMLAVGTILKEAGVVKEPPYKNVLVLGLLHDAEGRKLSKSLRNYGSLEELFNKYGADALRWFMASVNQPWDPKNFDPKVVDEGIKKTFLILTNVLSFWKLYPQATVVDAQKASHPLDRWVLARLASVVKDTTADLDHYAITPAARRLSDFVTDVSTWYVRRSRDRFKGDEAPMASAILREVLLTISQLLAPFTPFLAEHIYREVGGEKPSVHLADWPVATKVDEHLLTDMTLARTVVEQALGLRAKAGIKIRQPLEQLVVTTALRPDLDEIVRAELNVKELHAAETLPTGNDWAVGETVALDITISDELREEGYERDLAREFNALRKTAGLKPTDSIVAHCEAGTMAAKIIERFGDQFLKDVRAKGATPSLEGATHQAEVVLGDEKNAIGLSRV